jgi:3-deoxy-7-phosphoheptulonate synthase
MVVVMRSTAKDGDIERVVDAVTAVGGECFVSKGRNQTIIGLVGDLTQFAELPLHAFPHVEDVIRVSRAFKLVSNDAQPRPSTVEVGRSRVGRDSVTIIAGPCAVETPEQAQARQREAEIARSTAATALRVTEINAHRRLQPPE